MSNGEFVINAAATKRNRQLLEAVNSGQSIRGTETNSDITFIVNDQRSAEDPPIEIEERNINGERVVEMTVKATTRKQLKKGDYDSVMAQRYGLRPVAG